MKQKHEQNDQILQERKQDMADALLKVFSSTDEAFDAFDINSRGSVTIFQFMRGLVDFRINLGSLRIDPKQAFDLIDAPQKGHVNRFVWRSFFEGCSVKPEAFKPSLADVVVDLPQGPKLTGGKEPRLRRPLSARRFTVQGLDGEVSAEILSPQWSPSLSSAIGGSSSCPKRPRPPALPGAKRSVTPKAQEHQNPTNAQIAELCKQVISNCGSLETAFQAFDVNGNGKITRVLFDSALAALQVSPESSFGLKSSRLFGLMSYREGHITRATWDRFWEEHGIDLNLTIEVPEEKIVRRSAWKTAVKLTATTYSGILQRRNQNLAQQKEASEESLGHHDLSDEVDAKAEDLWHSQNALSGAARDIQLPPSPNDDDSLLMRRKMNLRRFLGRELYMVGKRDSCELDPLSPAYASTRAPSTHTDDESDASDCDFQSMPNAPLPKKPVSDFVQHLVGELGALRRMGWLDVSKTYGVDMTPAQMSSLQHELELQGIAFEVVGEGAAMRIQVKGDGPHVSIVAEPERSERPEPKHIRDLSACKTYGADMTPEQKTSLMNEHELQGDGLNVRTEPPRPSFKLPSPSPGQSLPSIGSPTLPHQGSTGRIPLSPKESLAPSPHGSARVASGLNSTCFCTEEIDKENCDALKSEAFARYASASPGHEQKIFRKADLATLVAKLRNGGTNRKSNRNSGSNDKSNWVTKGRIQRIRFIKSIGCLEKLFDEALELQIDMHSGSSVGLTKDFFNVYIQMCATKLGWSSTSLLFTLLDDPDCLSPA